MDNFDLKKYLVENKVTTNSKMITEEEGSFFAEFAEAYNTFLEDSVSPEETENFTFTDDNRGIDKSIEYPEASLVEKVTVDALRAASIDSVEKLYTANNMKYNGESIADFLNALKINDSYTGIDYEIIPGVSLSFTEEV